TLANELQTKISVNDLIRTNQPRGIRKMKTKLLGVALFVSAALLASAQAGGGFHGGGGGAGGGGHFAGSAARAGGGPSFRSMPMRNFSGNRMIYSGQRFSSISPRLPRSMEFRPQHPNSNVGTSLGNRQFTGGNINRGNQASRFSNEQNRVITNP